MGSKEVIPDLFCAHISTGRPTKNLDAIFSATRLRLPLLNRRPDQEIVGRIVVC